MSRAAGGVREQDVCWVGAVAGEEASTERAGRVGLSGSTALAFTLSLWWGAHRGLEAGETAPGVHFSEIPLPWGWGRTPWAGRKRGGWVGGQGCPRHSQRSFVGVLS